MWNNILETIKNTLVGILVILGMLLIVGTVINYPGILVLFVAWLIGYGIRGVE